MSQIGIFVRVVPGAPWKWEGFHNSSKSATLRFNMIEIEHPYADAIWFDPDEVFTSMTRPKEEEE